MNITDRGDTVAVVGGGISGIAAAHYLTALGHHVTILEADTRFGGRVGCEQLGDRLIEFGGKNIGRQYPLFREFVRAMGEYRYEPFGINTSAVTDGRVRLIDSEHKLRSLYHLLKLTGGRDVLKMVALVNAVRRDTQNGYLGGPYFRRLAERYDRAPLPSYFGERLCRNFLRPILVRMNGAEPDEYYLGNLGSNLKMILDQYEQLEVGIHTVVEDFARRIEIECNARVCSLVVPGTGPVSAPVVLDVEDASGKRRLRGYAAAVFATPAPITGMILRAVHPRTSEALDRIVYNPVAVAIAKYSRPVFTPERRAVVFGPEYELSNAGAYGINDLDIVRYTFSGRSARQSIGAHTPGAELLARGEMLLAPHLPVHAHDRIAFVTRYFTLGLCAYAPYHHRIMRAIDTDLADVPAIALAGDYVRGASIEACFQSAQQAARRLDPYLRQAPKRYRRAS